MTQFTVDSSDHAPSLLAGRYQLGAEIGRGGMAVVYRARDCRLNRDVAVKMLRGVLLDPRARDRFTVEGQTLARLSHPGLISMFDAGTDDDSPYLVMELVDGQTLHDYYQRYEVDAEQVCAIGAELADALAYVHACGIVHRDVKPGNVLLGRDGRVRLADFGIARMVADAGKQTATGLTLGTAAYLSPEQVREEPITGAADVYALGLVLLESLTGKPAFSGPQNVVALARLIAPPRIDGSIPPALRELLVQMTSNGPQHRPGAAEVAGRLRSMSAAGLDIASLQAPKQALRQPPRQAPAWAPGKSLTQPAAHVPPHASTQSILVGDTARASDNPLSWTDGTLLGVTRPEVREPAFGPAEVGQPGRPDPRAGWVGMRAAPRRRRNLALMLAAVLAVSVVPAWLLTARLTDGSAPKAKATATALAQLGAADQPAKAETRADKANPRKAVPVQTQQTIQPAQTKATAPAETSSTAAIAAIPGSGATASTSVDLSNGATLSRTPSPSATRPMLAQTLEHQRKRREERREEWRKKRRKKKHRPGRK